METPQATVATCPTAESSPPGPSPPRCQLAPRQAILLPRAIFASSQKRSAGCPPPVPDPPNPTVMSWVMSSHFSLQEEGESQRSLPDPTAARPSRRHRVCPRASGRLPSPRCTRRGTATGGHPSPTASGRTGRRPQVGLWALGGGTCPQSSRAALAGRQPPPHPPHLDSPLPPPHAGSTPFPYNPLTMRLPSGVVTAAPAAPLPQGTPGSQHHAWDEEPKPLLCSQYETLSDSE